jgi:hypothetical protein
MSGEIDLQGCDRNIALLDRQKIRAVTAILAVTGWTDPIDFPPAGVFGADNGVRLVSATESRSPKTLDQFKR